MPGQRYPGLGMLTFARFAVAHIPVCVHTHVNMRAIDYRFARAGIGRLTFQLITEMCNVCHLDVISNTPEVICCPFSLGLACLSC